jgi:hypothetical protein
MDDFLGMGRSQDKLHPPAIGIGCAGCMGLDDRKAWNNRPFIAVLAHSTTIKFRRNEPVPLSRDPIQQRRRII